MDRTLGAIAEENFAQAKSLFSEVIHGVFEGRHADPGELPISSLFRNAPKLASPEEPCSVE